MRCIQALYSDLILFRTQQWLYAPIWQTRNRWPCDSLPCHCLRASRLYSITYRMQFLLVFPLLRPLPNDSTRLSACSLTCGFCLLPTATAPGPWLPASSLYFFTSVILYSSHLALFFFCPSSKRRKQIAQDRAPFLVKFLTPNHFRDLWLPGVQSIYFCLWDRRRHLIPSNGQGCRTT